MRTHGSEPFEGVEDLLLFPILGLIDDGGFLRDVSHSLLGKGGADKGFRSDQAKDLKSYDNSKKSAPKFGLEAHFQPQNRPPKIT